MPPCIEVLNFSGSTYRLTGLPLTSLARLASTWQVKQSSFVGFCATAVPVAYNSAKTRHPTMAAAVFIAAQSLTFGKLADVRSAVANLRVAQFLLVGRHSVLTSRIYGDPFVLARLKRRVRLNPHPHPHCLPGLSRTATK